MNELIIDKRANTITVCNECNFCKCLVALDECICHHCGKPIPWSRTKWRLFKYLNLFSTEYLGLCHNYHTVRSAKRIKDTKQVTRRDREITCQQLSCSMESLEELAKARRLEV